ncbi:MAG: 4-hydroxythreonine-4-phosphate dehydrogenase PdxA [Muribaculaceae bacterium]|nr:4-hydroxythreonine-4-phosphate dehydrogenase PdxA [Muribaculaceae bacterium]
MIKVGITQGDPNGVGPEIIIKALSPEGITELMTPVIFANKGIILSTMQRLKGENFHFQGVNSAANAKPGKINLVNVGDQQLTPDFGNATPEGGRSAYLALEAAVQALEEGDIDVLVTAPINKSAIQSEDFRFPGHTEYLEARFAEEEEEDAEDHAGEIGETASPDDENGLDPEDASESSDPSELSDASESPNVIEPTATEDDKISSAPDTTIATAIPGENRVGSGRKAQMILFNDDLRVALLTTHLPISEISGYITEENIMDAVGRLDKTLRSDFACDRPRIAVLSLNPHAGDNGLLGSEEKEVMIPALRRLRENGVLAFGPYAADGFFGSGEWRKFDGVLAMYHDQGLAPFKTIAGQSGVNFTAGLEYVRTSPDHGTAYDIAGQMQADPTSMREAIYKAIDIYNARERYEEMSENPLKIKVKN